jgi:hypothetical protein
MTIWDFANNNPGTALFMFPVCHACSVADLSDRSGAYGAKAGMAARSY